jgi:hypothetical protein
MLLLWMHSDVALTDCIIYLVQVFSKDWRQSRPSTPSVRNEPFLLSFPLNVAHIQSLTPFHFPLLLYCRTTGPANQSWDRWFEGPQDLRRCRCWFLWSLAVTSRPQGRRKETIVGYDWVVHHLSSPQDKGYPFGSRRLLFSLIADLNHKLCGSNDMKRLTLEDRRSIILEVDWSLFYNMSSVPNSADWWFVWP